MQRRVAYNSYTSHGEGQILPGDLKMPPGNLPEQSVPFFGKVLFSQGCQTSLLFSYTTKDLIIALICSKPKCFITIVELGH